MSVALGKENIVKILADPNSKVIAHSGKWGTGKTHLWRDVQAGSAKDAVKNAINVSLFALGTSRT